MSTLNKYKVIYSDDPSRLAGGEKLDKVSRVLGGSSTAEIKRMPMFNGLKIHSIKKIGSFNLGKNN